MTTYSRRSDRHQKKSGKKWLWSILSVLLVALCIGGGYGYIWVYNFLLNEKISIQTKALVEKLEKEKESDSLSKNHSHIETSHSTSLVFLPKEKKLPFDQAEKELATMTEGERKKLPDSNKSIVVGSIIKKNVTEKLDMYKMHVETYAWQKSKSDFEKDKEVSSKSVYLITETGKPVTARDLIPSDADLMAIHQVVEQKILNEAADANAILDTVLDMPRLTFDSAIDVMEDHLAITLPENQTGTTKINLPYNDIQSFIQKDLIDPSQLTEKEQLLDKEKKYIALTFDDGPNPDTTPKLLKILEEKKVKATFFMLGKNVEFYPEVAKAVLDAGHEIGSHSYSHPQLNAIKEEKLREEIKKTDQAIFHATGILPKILRPPYGAIDETSALISGKAIIQWDIDSYDWESKNTEATIKRVNDTAEDGGIVLMHDIHPSTIEAVGPIIDSLREQGYELVTTSQLLQGIEKPMYQYFGQHDHRKI